MQAGFQTKHCDILAKIIEWAFANSIEINVKSHQEQVGLKEVVEITISKHGKKEMVRFFDWAEMTRPLIQQLIMDQAFNLCLTRLEL